MTQHRRHYPEGERAVMRIITILGAGLIGLMYPTASHAALDFTFSFTNTLGSVPGTVTGEIDGLVDGTGVAATNVTLESYPSGLGLPAPPQGANGDVLANSFDVSNGIIQSAEYRDDEPAFALVIQGGLGEVTALDGERVQGPVGFSPVPVPDPGPIASLALLALGLFLLRPKANRRVHPAQSAQPEGV